MQCSRQSATDEAGVQSIAPVLDAEAVRPCWLLGPGPGAALAVRQVLMGLSRDTQGSRHDPDCNMESVCPGPYGDVCFDHKGCVLCWQELATSITQLWPFKNGTNRLQPRQPGDTPHDLPDSFQTPFRPLTRILLTGQCVPYHIKGSVLAQTNCYTMCKNPGFRQFITAGGCQLLG